MTRWVVIATVALIPAVFMQMWASTYSPSRGIYPYENTAGAIAIIVFLVMVLIALGIERLWRRRSVH